MQLETLGLLRNIREASQFIVDDTAGLTFDAFLRDRRARQLVERNFEIIGEAMDRLHRRNPALANRITAYRKIIDFRNALIHGYDVIDYPTVWQVVQESLPVLRAEVERLLLEAEGEIRETGQG